MSSITEALKLLEDKLEDLYRDTKFCVNNYDYHHKNNEHEIIANIQRILKDSLEDGQQFLDDMKSVRSSIEAARTKCLELDKLLIDLGVDEVSAAAESCPPGSQSFLEKREAGECCDGVLEENKENTT